MAARNAARYISRRFSSGGKVLGEEEKAAENVYIKKAEKEKLEKLIQKEKLAAAASTEAPVAEVAKPSQSSSSSSSAGVSQDKDKNYAILAGFVTIAGALGWYALSKKDKEKPELQD